MEWNIFRTGFDWSVRRDSSLLIWMWRLTVGPGTVWENQCGESSSVRCCLIHFGATEKTKLDNELELGKGCLSSDWGFLSMLGQHVAFGPTMRPHIIERECEKEATHLMVAIKQRKEERERKWRTEEWINISVSCSRTCPVDLTSFCQAQARKVPRLTVVLLVRGLLQSHLRQEKEPREEPGGFIPLCVTCVSIPSYLPCYNCYASLAVGCELLEAMRRHSLVVTFSFLCMCVPGTYPCNRV